MRRAKTGASCGWVSSVEQSTAMTASEAAAAAVRAGDDLCCGKDYNALVRAVKDGLISEKEIDIAVSRVLEPFGTCTA